MQLLFVYSFCSFNISLLSEVLYRETGKCLQKIAKILRNIRSIFVPNVAILIRERNLIGADFDPILGIHFWTVSECHAINKKMV